MNKKLVFWIKLILTVAVVGFIGYEIYKNAGKLRQEHFTVNFGYIAASLAAFAAFMVQSSLVWNWLARRMGDRTPPIRAMGAYVYSQMGKYVPGKVALLLMRVERAKRAGMDPQICIVATLIENAMYMVSGGIIAVATLAFYAQDQLKSKDKPLIFSALIIGLAAMCTVFHPRIFYSLVNRLLRKMNRPEVAPALQLRVPHLIAAVLGFIPCWLLGGLSLWCACRAIHFAAESQFHMPSIADFVTFPGAVALGVVSGMAFLTPGGVGTREVAMSLPILPIVGTSWAMLAVGLQRLVQIASEVLLGLIGGALTRKKSDASTPPADVTPTAAPAPQTPP